MNKLLALTALASSFTCSAVVERPCVWLSFDNPERLAADSGVLALDLDTTGRVTAEPRGVVGGCAYFDGASFLSAGEIPAAFPSGGESVTASAWVRAARDVGSNAGWVSWGDKANGRGNSIRLQGPDRLHNYWNNRDLTVAAEGVGDGLWHHVVIVADAANRRAVYLDGRLCGWDAATPNCGKGIFLVGKTMHDIAFKGWLDEVKLWKRAFTDDDVFALYKTELSREVFSHEPLAAALTTRPLDVTPVQVHDKGFTVTLKVDLSREGRAPSRPDSERPRQSAALPVEELLYTAGPARLVLRQAGADKKLADYDRRYGNYLNWPLRDGTCPVLEATIAERATQIGIPLGFLANPDGVHTVTLQYAPPRWAICVDGHVDEAFPIPAYPVVWPGDAQEKVFSTRVKGTDFVSPARADALPSVPDARKIAEPIQYWTPQDHNTWVGDVAPAFLDGKLHVFYLIDRRHHTGGMGTGRHQFAHLSSDDLVNWVEHPLAVAITEDWQTCGTGTPFLKDGKVALAFGWHTSRYPQRKDKPLGGTYASSEDGIHFTNSGVMISDAQNPSIYNLADGRYELVTSYGGSIGIFHSRDLLKWDLFDAKLPFRGDCPSLFDMNGHRYLLQGFTNMAYSPDGTPGSFVNWTSEPDALYEGLCVPMVAKWKNDRRLYLGWLNHLYGWGGWLVFREVVAYPDGHLGLKWVPEIEPPTKPRAYAVKGGERFQLRLTPEKGGAALVFTVDPATREASFGDDVPNLKWEKPRSGGNFKIGGVRGIDRDYAVRLIVHYDAKADATIFDAEIAGQRTMICRRAGRYK